MYYNLLARGLDAFLWLPTANLICYEGLAFLVDCKLVEFDDNLSESTLEGKCPQNYLSTTCRYMSLHTRFHVGE